MYPVLEKQLQTAVLYAALAYVIILSLERLKKKVDLGHNQIVKEGVI